MTNSVERRNDNFGFDSRIGEGGLRICKVKKSEEKKVGAGLKLLVIAADI